ncbi:hypothetical protein BN1708_004640 [Verticillium longisporum]|uniref:Uncharacterized protein n=1 Tax=Verticillium longisporum TaxID=100787 RepID=A0A0G4M2B1_VERLO|nr:hypothetical protein BN1708_004640 [Verticillium longisporum]
MPLRAPNPLPGLGKPAAPLLVRSWFAAPALLPGMTMELPGALRPDARVTLLRKPRAHRRAVGPGGGFLRLGLGLLLLRGDEALHRHHLLGQLHELALFDALLLQQSPQLAVVVANRVHHSLELVDLSAEVPDLRGVTDCLRLALLLGCLLGRINARHGRIPSEAQALVLLAHILEPGLEVADPLLPATLVALLQRRVLGAGAPALVGSGIVFRSPAGAHAGELALGLLGHVLSRLTARFALRELVFQLFRLALAADNLFLDAAQHRLHLAAPFLPALLLGGQVLLFGRHLAYLLHALADTLLGVADRRLKGKGFRLLATEGRFEAADLREEARLEAFELARCDCRDTARRG